MRTLISFLAIFLFAYCQLSQAQIPKTISYQGILSESDVKVDGDKIFTFKLYETESGSEAIWSEIRVLNVKNGVFEVNLGEETSLDLPFDKPYWLGIKVGSGEELSPRISLTASAYSLNTQSIVDSVVVKSINNLKDNVTLAAGDNITITSSENTITIAAAGSSGGNTLDQAYDQGGAGAGRMITADAGAVNITGSGGLTIDGKVGIGVASPSYPLSIHSENHSYGMRLDHDMTTAGTTIGMSVDVDNTYSGSANTYGIRGIAMKDNGNSNVYGVYGYADGTAGGSKFGVYGGTGGSGTLWAGYFKGNVNVTGTLSKAGGSFKIDHPLDPENKYLYHSFVESPDMMNIYNGNVILDNNGEAWIDLPDWFEALNKDFRYQLTCIGGYAQVYIAEKISGNRFKIAGGQPGLEVSWLVTGVRQDAFAEKNRIQVERDKTGSEAGKYLHPAAFDRPESMGIDYEKNKE